MADPALPVSLLPPLSQPHPQQVLGEVGRAEALVGDANVGEHACEEVHKRPRSISPIHNRRNRRINPAYQLVVGVIERAQDC